MSRYLLFVVSLVIGGKVTAALAADAPPIWPNPAPQLSGPGISLREEIPSPNGPIVIGPRRFGPVADAVEFQSPVYHPAVEAGFFGDVYPVGYGYSYNRYYYRPYYAYRPSYYGGYYANYYRPSFVYGYGYYGPAYPRYYAPPNPYYGPSAPYYGPSLPNYGPPFPCEYPPPVGTPPPPGQPALPFAVPPQVAPPQVAPPTTAIPPQPGN